MKNPKLISKPFAQNGQKNVIPEKYEASMESNQATWDQGFGQITMLPVSAGGLPPKGQDFNGILNQMCETIVHISKGGVFKFSADYATAINGYPKGAILQSEDEKKYYQSLIDNNKVNFNTASQDQIKTSWKLVMTDDLLDQLSKKLESSSVVQSTGASTTSVMSQKASTDSFHPKGNYADKSSVSQQSFSGAISSPSSIIATSEVGELSLDVTREAPLILYREKLGRWNYIKLQAKDGVVAYIGDSYTKAESNVNFQPKGNYQPAGDYALAGVSYTKSESDNKYQAKGNYQPSGNYALVGASYTKSESDGKFQLKGDYQKSGNYADKSSASQQSFAGAISSPSSIIATSEVGTIALDTTKTKPVMLYRELLGRWCSVEFQAKDGVVAYIGDIENSELIPHPIPWSLPTAPSGYLICQGQTFNKATYPKLGIAYPSGRLPDLRGEFIRGADAGRGIDVGREILSNQLGNSLLSTNLMEVDAPNFKQYKKVVEWIGNTGTNSSSGYGIWQQIEGQNGNETRPRNIAFLYIVRAA